MTGWGIVFDPLVPWLIIAALAALGLVLLAFLVWAGRKGVVLRGLALGLLLLGLANPSLRQEDREHLSDIAVLVVDHSQSQQQGQRPAQTDAIANALKADAARLPDTELRVVDVTSGLGSEEDGTNAFAALNRALADIPPERFGGALFITDGQIHDVPQSLKGAGGPLHGIITGSRGEKDRRVVIDQAPRFGIVGKDQTLRFHVEDNNGDGGSIGVTITQGDGETRRLDVKAGETAEITVPITHGGQNIVELTADPLAGEISAQNNRALSVIEGIRDRLRVLLVSGQPHPGERTWRNLLKADASVDLVHFTILRPPEKQDGTPIKELALIAFPTRELFVDKLDQFDLVIFDRYRRQAVLPKAYLANVADYVLKGGAVLIASGPDFAAEDGLYETPLADVIAAPPSGTILEQGFKPTLTQPGRRHPVTAGLPGSEGETPSWGRWFRLVETTGAKGDVLMAGPDEKPLLVLAHAGEGRVAQILSDQGWLWARGFEGGGPENELLRRIGHWLMKEPDLEEEALRATQSGKDLVVERRTMADAAAPVEVTRPSGSKETVTLKQVSPGLWQGKLALTEPGLHRLSDGKLQAVAAAGNAEPRETADLVATTAKLQPAAAATGGAVVWAEDGTPRLVKADKGRNMAGNGWLALTANHASRVTALREVPLFATLLVLGALLLAFCGMWYREGR